MPRCRFGNRIMVAAAVLAGSACLGCQHVHDRNAERSCCQPPDFNCCVIPDIPVPKELNKMSLPPYIVETPDVLQIDAVHLIPRPPYHLHPFDVLYLSAENEFEGAKIAGLYPVEAGGMIDLGSRYGGKMTVADLTTDEARKAIERQVRRFAPRAIITVSLAESRSVQQIAGQHVVRPDGTVSLGSYGSVYVAGQSLLQVKQAIEAHLSEYLYRPEVMVDVASSKSKFYYVIADFGAGEQVKRLPHTGNETVLDAVALIGGVSAASSKKIWIARPSPTEDGHDQLLPVDWCGVSRRGEVKTNYQIMPFDRVYILSQPRSKFGLCIARLLPGWTGPAHDNSGENLSQVSPLPAPVFESK